MAATQPEAQGRLLITVRKDVEVPTKGYGPLWLECPYQSRKSPPTTRKP